MDWVLLLSHEETWQIRNFSNSQMAGFSSNESLSIAKRAEWGRESWRESERQWNDVNRLFGLFAFSNKSSFTQLTTQLNNNVMHIRRYLSVIYIYIFYIFWINFDLFSIHYLHSHGSFRHINAFDDCLYISEYGHHSLNFFFFFLKWINAHFTNKWIANFHLTDKWKCNMRRMALKM